MPVDSKHPDYTDKRPVWDMMRRVAGGQRTVHAAGEVDLPLLTGETDKEYAARKVRALFFNATWRTVEGLRGMLFRKSPTWMVSADTEPMLKDVTKGGVGLPEFAFKATTEVLTVGRVGVMVDFPKVERVEGAPPMTKSIVEKLNLRPHLAMYTAESAINWREKWENNKTVLARVVLEESAQIEDENDEFVTKSETRWRVLDLFAGKYRVREYRKNDAGKDELIGAPYFPEMNNKPIGFIPFQFIGVDDTTPAVEDPPLVDLAYVNLSHYLTTADLEHGAHKTALPQPWIAGITPKMDASGNLIPVTLYMGGGHAWTFDNADATVGMLEYTGQGLAALEARLDAKERQMAVLGARMLEAQKKAQEAAETAGIHRAGEQSALASQGATISRGIQQALSWFDLWAGGNGEATFLMNADFFPAQMTPAELKELVAAWQTGALSEQELFEKFQKGGVVRDDKEFEEHQTEISTNPPALLADPAPAEVE